MSGVIVGMRRTLLSCTSLAALGRAALGGLGIATLLPGEPAHAQDTVLLAALAAFPSFNRQEIAVIATALALLGFSVLAAILLMRSRYAAARNEARLNSRIRDLQVEADNYRALLFAEPQIIISWAAGDDHPQISGDIALVAGEDSLQRILAFGTWLPPEPALQMDHAVDALREAGEGFLLNLATSNGRTIEALGRAIGGQAIVRIRELGGVRRELTETNLRYRQLLAETDMLRGFVAAAPWPIWTRGADGDLSYVNDAYARATDAPTMTDALGHRLELLDSTDRAAMERILKSRSTFEARLPIVTGGERRIYDVHAINVADGSVGVAIDADEADALRAA
ncbi:MAG: two-component sensor histidine kinase, partial [Bradyrhizobium sp.]